MTSLSRAFAIVDLFTPRRMVWTIDGIAGALAYSRPTAYRYVRELVSTGLLSRFGDGGYSLGPRIVELDLLIRGADPLLAAGLPAMREWVGRTGCDVNLIGLYGDRVVTIHQERGSEMLPLSFGRGRPLPPFRGAGSKVIQAHRPAAHLRRAYDRNRSDAEAGGLGSTWLEARTALRRIRARGAAVSVGELDAGFCGLAVPVRGPRGAVVGCVVAALTQERFALARLDRLTDEVRLVAGRIESDLRVPAVEAPHLSSARSGVAGAPLMKEAS